MLRPPSVGKLGGEQHKKEEDTGERQGETPGGAPDKENQFGKGCADFNTSPDFRKYIYVSTGMVMGRGVGIADATSWR